MEQTQVTPETQVAEKVFTQGEVDHIVGERLQRERKSFEEKMKAAREEAQKLAQMSADERQAHERAQYEQALSDREQALRAGEMKLKGYQWLGEKGLSGELIHNLNLESEETCMAGIEALERVIREEVRRNVEERMKGNIPQRGNSDEAAQIAHAFGMRQETRRK